MNALSRVLFCCGSSGGVLACVCVYVCVCVCARVTSVLCLQPRNAVVFFVIVDVLSIR